MVEPGRASLATTVTGKFGASKQVSHPATHPPGPVRVRVRVCATFVPVKSLPYCHDPRFGSVSVHWSRVASGGGDVVTGCCTRCTLSTSELHTTNETSCECTYVRVSKHTRRRGTSAATVLSVSTGAGCLASTTKIPASLLALHEAGHRSQRKLLPPSYQQPSLRALHALSSFLLFRLHADLVSVCVCVVNANHRPLLQHEGRKLLAGTMSMTREVKVVLLGDTGVGKSSLVLRFVTEDFKEYSESTIGASFMSKVEVIDGVAYKYQIWDTAGQEKYHSLAPMYYRGAAAAIVVYDITNQLSFEKTQRWIEELQRHGPENIVLVIAGNKADLEDKRVVSKEKAKEFADSINGIFLETSAKTGQSVGDAFKGICARLKPLADDDDDDDEADVGGTGGQKKNGCC